MISAKRLSLQLTPLLDLLLIVIFAQYLEIEQTTKAEQQERAVALAEQQFELQELREKLQFTEQVLDATQQFRTEAEQKLTSVSEQRQAELDASVSEQELLEMKLRDVTDQRDRIIRAFKKIYAQSSEEIRKLLDKLAQTAGMPQPVSPERINELAAEMAESEPRDLATFLLAYEEIRKRCDIWELHLDPRGVVHLFDGQTKHSFRAGAPADFERNLFSLYKSLPQSKGLVILLVSYGEVRADLRQNVLLGLPAVTERMREDADGRTRFEYAVIGYLPEGESGGAVLPAESSSPENSSPRE
ncbi:hypothetical protein [Rubinisphaera brasiliensis]|uniref:Uncharacterized protein n=1 Tax=Rubinisphaera brasiliensis (strain ATCC 49424 / DSM 5305 / JCM 21570 / IAM 15109 / NBRC 103401 / IFAM 1448) TaxID=756272 RepID=F0SKW6_RUBBR|nr:hypothetical protein [Rubinisphaera brasiliensis]ADY59819.1 hypothetical protein Plabr_2217 [Rubinisphaera brasiliensis DSM 5305]